MIFVAGDAVSMGHLAGVVESALGHELEGRVESVGQLGRESPAGLGGLMAKYRRVFAGDVGVAWDEEPFGAKCGMETASVEERAREEFERWMRLIT